MENGLAHYNEGFSGCQAPWAVGRANVVCYNKPCVRGRMEGRDDMRRLTVYQRHTGKLQRPLALLVVSDLHDEPYDDLLPMLDGADALLVPGDVSDRYRQSASRGVQFLREAANRLPTYFSLGNHETRQGNYRALMETIAGTGARVLVNRYERFGEIWIGGWYAPTIVKTPDMLDEFERLDGAKVLLCHKPHEAVALMRGWDIDLVVAGHAHGGQIRVRGQGLYAPGQGLFPRYTRGVVEERLIISAGVGNPSHMPRWGNPCEVLKIILD